MYKVWYVRDKNQSYPHGIIYYGVSHEDCEIFVSKLLNSDVGYMWNKDELEIIYEEW